MIIENKNNNSLPKKGKSDTKPNNKKGKSPEDKDYIIKSDKPLIFRKKKIKKVSDLIGKGNFNKKEEEDFSLENEDLSEKFFDKYFSLNYSDSEKLKQKNINNSNSPNELIKSSLNKKASLDKNIEENDNVLNILQNFDSKGKKGGNKNIKDIEERNNFTYWIYQKVLEEERLEKLKKKKQFRNYVSTVYIVQCHLETLEGIHTSLQELLPELKIDINIPKFYIDNNMDRIYFIQKLDLSENNITFIHKDITFMPNLKILDLGNNLITDINKITELKNIKKLMFLTLRGNKICMIRGYRQFIIELCPVLSQLDSAEISEKELEIIHFKGSRFGEKRENGHGKIIQYPNPFKYLGKNFKMK